MSIILKSVAQIKAMQEAGKAVHNVHEAIKKAIDVGVTTKELERISIECLKEQNAISSFYGYEGSFGAGLFPGHICISINEEVIHGIPGLRKLVNGDIVSIDVGAYKNGFHGDAARSYVVGDAGEEDKLLVKATEESFFKGLRFAKAGKNLFDISEAICEHIKAQGFSIIRDFVGHGIGANLHEAPEIPNYRPIGRGRGARLCAGMTLAIEPMVAMGRHSVEILPDKWTVVTKDGSKSAHYENTILITDGEPEILTMG